MKNHQKQKKHRKLQLHKKRRTEKRSQDRKMMFGGGSAGSVKAGGIKIQFPTFPSPTKSPITITTPSAAYPTVIANPLK